MNKNVSNGLKNKVASREFPESFKFLQICLDISISYHYIKCVDICKQEEKQELCRISVGKVTFENFCNHRLQSQTNSDYVRRLGSKSQRAYIRR